MNVGVGVTSGVRAVALRPAERVGVLGLPDLTDHRLPRRCGVNGRQGAQPPRAGASVGCGSFRRASSALCWPEAGATSRGRRRASSTSTSAQQPARARTRGRNRPRRPARGRAPDPPCRTPARLARVLRSAPASSRRAARNVLARSAARVVRRRRFRGRDSSRQRRVSRDRRPAHGPRRGRTRSPGLVGPHASRDSTQRFTPHNRPS